MNKILFSRVENMFNKGKPTGLSTVKCEVIELADDIDPKAYIEDKFNKLLNDITRAKCEAMFGGNNENERSVVYLRFGNQYTDTFEILPKRIVLDKSKYNDADYLFALDGQTISNEELNNLLKKAYNKN